MGDVVDLKQYRVSHEERLLERDLIARSGDGTLLLADALTILRQDVRSTLRITELWTRASTYVCYHPVQPDGWLVKGAAELLLAKDVGFDSLYNGIGVYTADPFNLRFARYAIRRCPFPQETRTQELGKLEEIFTEKKP